MKKLLASLILVFLTDIAFAVNIRIEVNPPAPVKEENFQVIFKIRSPSNSQPYISFDPGFAEVLGKKSSGVSISTTIVNGRVSTVREASYIFDLIAPRAGRLNLKDIVVDIDGTKTRLPNKVIKITSTRTSPQNYFLQAEVSNVNPFLGEGFNVNYYLYYRYSMSIIGHEILRFPSLNNFIKRFYMPSSKVETIEKDGYMYSRKLIYSARLYPEKEGELKIDPVKIKIQYPKRTRGGVGFFGFGLTQYATKSISSKQVKIKVRSFEGIEIPKNYSGLIGDNNFRLEVTRNKYMVNEAIELKLIVEGEGALEKFESPKLLLKDELEEFDTKSSFEEINHIRGRKTFEYTYLPRKAFSDPERIFKISIFDSTKMEFIDKEIKIPALVVSGQAFNGYSNQSVEGKSKSKNENLNLQKEIALKGILGPITEVNKMAESWIRVLIIFVASIIIFILAVEGFELHKRYRLPKEVTVLNFDLKRNGVDYHRLFRLLYYLKNSNMKEVEDIKLIVSNSELSDSAKGYFTKALEVGEIVSFSDKGDENNSFHYEDKYFKELLSKIGRMKHNESLQ
ncbi:MAG: BatD family protein [Bacteriovoracaceae bacterium]